MKQSYEFPRVSTRGYYDLHTGKKLKTGNGYNLFPKKKFDKIFKADEIVIFVHGMRNSPKGAVMGGRTLRRKLRKLGYKYPVVSFSYDANIRRAHLLDKPHNVKLYHKLIGIANKISKSNGDHLTKFIIDLKTKNPDIKIHLVGHSLGCNVVSWTNSNVKSVHLLGSPVEIDEFHRFAYADKIINYYNNTDIVIKEGVDKGECKSPSCLNKVNKKLVGLNIINNPCNAVHHGFRAYADKLRKFP